MADNYEVKSQREVLDLGTTGQAVRSMEITAATKPTGVEFTETVPITAYNSETVAAQLGARAASIEAVHTL